MFLLIHIKLRSWNRSFGIYELRELLLVSTTYERVLILCPWHPCQIFGKEMSIWRRWMQWKGDFRHYMTNTLAHSLWGLNSRHTGMHDFLLFFKHYTDSLNSCRSWFVLSLDVVQKMGETKLELKQENM